MENKKIKRILAVIGILLLLGIYASALVFAFLDSPKARDCLTAAIYCTVAVPVFLYAFGLITRYLKDKKK